MALARERPRRTAEDWWALPEGVRTELIDGEFWDLATPTRKHQEIVIELGARLRSFIREHGGPCKAYVAPFAVDLFADGSTIVEPDVLVVCDRDKLTEHACMGAPDLIVEVVSPSNPGMDYVTKLSHYQAAGVREYWICDPRRERTLVYRFDSGDIEADAVPAIYPFAEPVSSSVLEGPSFDFSAVIEAM